MKNRALVLPAALMIAASSSVYAEIAVVVNPGVAFADMTEDDISRLFLGKTKNFPNGETAIPINQDEGAASRDKFNETVVKKNASQLKAYWSQLVFTGKGTPPKDGGKDADVKKLIAANPNMIGYIDAGAVDASMKVVFKVP